MQPVWSEVHMAACLVLNMPTRTTQQLTEHILRWLDFPYSYQVSASQHTFNPCNSSNLHVTSTPYSNYFEQTLLLFGLPKEGYVSRLWDRANSASASKRADNILCQSGSSKIVVYLHLHFHIQIPYKLRNIYNHFICTIAKKMHCFPPQILKLFIGGSKTKSY